MLLNLLIFMKLYSWEACNVNDIESMWTKKLQLSTQQTLKAAHLPEFKNADYVSKIGPSTKYYGFNH